MREGNGWTGGQYSLFRALFGAYLFVHFLHLVPWGAELFSDRGMVSRAADSPLVFLFPNILAIVDGPAFVSAFLLSGAIAALLFAGGFRDKWAALWCWYVLACLFGRNPLIQNPSLPYAGWMLLAHVAIPAAPYGSWDARGRADPSGGWRFPREIFFAAWAVLALSYSYSGWTKLQSASWRDGTMLGYVLENPLARDGALREWILSLPPAFLHTVTFAILWIEVLFVVAACSRRLRPWAWAAMLVVQLGFAVLLDFADLTLAMLLFHLFTFDPAWVPSTRVSRADEVYFDGHCGLCHRVVRFLVAEDRHGTFRYAPLQGQAIRRALGERQRSALPDSFVVITEAGAVLTRADAVLHVLARLGGLWRLVGALLTTFPMRWLDAAYDRVGRRRQKLFDAPATSCPLVSPELQARFLP